MEKEIYIIKREVVNNIDNGETINDISSASYTNVYAFNNLEDAKQSLKELYEDDVCEILDEYEEEWDEEEDNEDKDINSYDDDYDDGYSEKYINEDNYSVIKWNEYGVGIGVNCYIEKIIVH